MIKAPLNRRRFLIGSAGLSLSGCDRLTESEPTQRSFSLVEDLTYRAQRMLLGAHRLAPEFSEADISPQFKANGSINPQSDEYRQHATESFVNWRLEVAGLVARPMSLSLAELRALPARTQITRHDCVEGWSSIGQWTGTPLAHILDLVQPKPEARFVAFQCADSPDRDEGESGGDGKKTGGNSLQAEPDPYYETIDLLDAHHPQTILAYEMNGKSLPIAHGAPLRLRLERQLGYKMAKYIMRVELIDSFAALGNGHGGYWEDRGYEWYAGI
jgi:DMSO/TMAO reductase YedYZ molybdopterin-dependent catalytic subunit